MYEHENSSVAATYTHQKCLLLQLSLVGRKLYTIKTKLRKANANDGLLTHLAQNTRKSLPGFVELGIDPNHSDEAEYLGQHGSNVLGMSLGQVDAWVFEHGEELEITLRLM